jgi:hypothetical protein
MSYELRAMSYESSGWERLATAGRGRTNQFTS